MRGGILRGWIFGLRISWIVDLIIVSLCGSILPLDGSHMSLRFCLIIEFWWSVCVWNRCSFLNLAVMCGDCCSHDAIVAIWAPIPNQSWVTCTVIGVLCCSIDALYLG